MRKKIIKMVAVFSIVFFISGCFNYRDINKLVFAIAAVIDIDDADNIVLYDESFKPYRSSSSGTESGVRLISKGIGKTLFEAVRDLNLTSSYKNNYTQVKALIFTERAARRGLKTVVDFIDRDQELLIRPYVFVYMGSDVEALLRANFKDEEYIGQYLYNLTNNVGSSSRAVVVNVNKFLGERVRSTKTVVVPVIMMAKNNLEDKLEIRGAAAIKEDRMVDYIPRQESQGYNFLMNKVQTGTLEVTNPDNPEGYVTLEILGNKTKTSIKYEKGKIKLTKKINVKTSVGEVQYRMTLGKEEVYELERLAEDNLERYTSQIFNDFKKKDIDIFDVKGEMFRHYPRAKIEDPIKECELEVHANVEIEGSSTKSSEH